MTFEINGGNYVYRVEGRLKSLVGSVTYTDTVRIDDNTVADVMYEFDLQQGQYVEQSRVERSEPLPPELVHPEARIDQLETESALLAIELMDTQIRLNQVEDEQAALLLELINKGAI